MSTQNGRKQMLCSFFEALADEDRLTIIGLLNEQEYSADGLAAALQLREPAVVKHLAKLRTVGLVNLRAVDQQRHYKLNHNRLKNWKKMIMDLEHSNQEVDREQPWIDELPLADYDKKVIKDSTRDGRLVEIPEKRQKLQAVLRWLILAFKPDVTYAEHEVNDLLTRYNEDYATLRRELINYGWLQRTPDGSQYWLTPQGEII